ncbi:hypothetical protein ACHAWF_018051 [Thalassiosira exigua]
MDAMDANDRDDDDGGVDFGLRAYLDIRADLEQWGEPSPSSGTSSAPRPRRSRGDGTPRATPPAAPAPTPGSARGRRGRDDGEAADEVLWEGEGGDGGEERGAPRGLAGVQTPEPPRARDRATAVDDDDDDEEGDEDGAEDDFLDDVEASIGDGSDPYRPYRDALLSFLRSREDLAFVSGGSGTRGGGDGGDVSLMQIDDDAEGEGAPSPEAAAAATESELKYLGSLAAACLARGKRAGGGGGDGGEPDDDDDDPSELEGDLWDLLSSLRSRGSASLLYCVDGEDPPEPTLARDPAAAVDSGPAEALDACLGNLGADDGGEGHAPDALVCANALLRRFLLSYIGDEAEGASDRGLRAPMAFVEKMLPNDLLDLAEEQHRGGNRPIDGSPSFSLLQDLRAEFLSVDAYLRAHAKYVRFLDVIGKTSPCQGPRESSVDGLRSKHEEEIASKMERNAFLRKAKVLCKIVVEASAGASDALTEVLTFGGGWLVDAGGAELDEGGAVDTEEAAMRSEEMEAIRSNLLPRVAFMLHEVSDQTAAWTEQIVHDARIRFGSASGEVLLALFESFDETLCLEEDDVSTTELTTSSRAAPGYWHLKALSLASVVANDANGLHETFLEPAMERFLRSMAETHVKLQGFLRLGETLFN